MSSTPPRRNWTRIVLACFVVAALIVLVNRLVTNLGTDEIKPGSTTPAALEQARHQGYAEYVGAIGPPQDPDVKPKHDLILNMFHLAEQCHDQGKDVFVAHKGNGFPDPATKGECYDDIDQAITEPGAGERARIEEYCTSRDYWGAYVYNLSFPPAGKNVEWGNLSCTVKKQRELRPGEETSKN